MKAFRSHRKSFAAGVIGLTFVAVGCGGSTHPSAAVAPLSATSKSTAVPDAAGSIGPAKHVKARGGGDFCRLVASAANTSSISGASADVIKSRIAAVRDTEKQAVDLAPDSLKSDVKVLFAASDQIYSALAKANYDYSKIKASDISALSEPNVTAAETRLKAYTTNVCKIS